MNGKNKDRDQSKIRKQNQAGQVLIESLLLMVLSIGLLGATLQYFKDTKTFGKITNAVWSGVAQMSEYGSWPNAATPVHPNSSIRTRTWDGK